MEEEKEILLYSESYPLKENKERERPKIVSQVHKLLSKVKIDPNKIYYKPLGPQHYEEVVNLHKEWFPVEYPQFIFDNSLLYNQGRYIAQGCFYFLEEEKKEIILGLIITEWRYVDKFLINETDKDILKEINKSIDYEEEVQFYLSKEKFYSICYIVSLGVIDECRKMNIGTNLINDVINYVIYFPFCAGVYLDVISDNFIGKKFYEKRGFSCYGKMKDYYTIGDKKYDGEVYVKIFNRKEKDAMKKRQNSMLTFKQKCYKYLIWKPYFLLVKLFMLFCLCRWFNNGIKIE